MVTGPNVDKHFLVNWYEEYKAMTHYSAAHINAIAEEGTKDEAIHYLQKHWNELQDAKAEIERLQSVVASYRLTERELKAEIKRLKDRPS